MKRYTYKMQWLFNNNEGDLKNCFAVIKAIGAKNLTEVVFRDSNLKVIDSYSGMVSYLSGEATRQTIKRIKKAIKENQNISCIELYRTN